MILYIDISNFVATRTHTGIQRVLWEFLHRLLKNKHSLCYHVIFYNAETSSFNKITEDELQIFLENTKNHIFTTSMQSMSLDDFEKNDIFFDMDGVWNNSLKRSYLYKILYHNNVKIINFIYDLVPVVLPQYSYANTVRNYVTFLYAVYQYSDMVFFDSRSAETDFFDTKKTIHSTRDISTRVVKLGSDIFQKELTIAEKYRPFLTKKYILFVGTLEPRKNQTLMLDVFEELSKQYPSLNLIFIGKEGWNNDKLTKRIDQHPLLNTTLYWLKNVDDSTLVSLYKHAFLCVYISAYEGFGLPIAESLSYGNVTITSKNSSMYEVGKTFADYLIYNSKNELYETIETYLTDSTLYEAKKSFIKTHYLPYSWDMTFSSITRVFEHIQTVPSVSAPSSLQFVFISIHPQHIAETIKAIDTYIHFVSSYIIVTRAELRDTFTKITSKHPIIVIDEQEILKEHSKDFQSKDHQSKNWLLRASLLNLDILEEQFVMLDDDNRPLKEIPMSHFIHNGKYNAYYYYDLLEWHNQKSDYDKGQKHTQKLLDKEGYELLSYSAHKPQIIDKSLFKQCIEHYFDYGLKNPIDEWSIYFNYSISLYPFLFSKKIFDTLNWPANPSDWDWIYSPEDYLYENYYESSYTEGLLHTLAHPTVDEKVILKEKQIKPYQDNHKHMQKIKPYYQALNLVHGVLKFASKEQGTCLCYSFPYYLEGTQGSWLKLALNYKVYGFKKEKLQLGYWIDEQEGAKTMLPINDVYYHENIIHFTISCTSLLKKKYTLCIDLFVDDKPLYGISSPYMVELYVK